MAGKSSLFAPTALLRQHTLRKGFLGGHKGWTVLGIMVWAPRVLKRLAGRNEELVATARLRPGETIELTAVKPLSRKERKRAQ